MGGQGGGPPPFAGGHHQGGFNAGGGMQGGGGRQIYVSNVCSRPDNPLPLFWVFCTLTLDCSFRTLSAGRI